jgi:hypothetical protein
MYLRFESNLDFPLLAKALNNNLTEETIGWDSENVYEWMYVDLPHLDFSLNVSREHGWAKIEDQLIFQYEDEGREDELNQIVQCGPVYVFGWNKSKADHVDQLPESLPIFIANQFSVEVSVYNRRINVDIPDGTPNKVISPTK